MTKLHRALSFCMYLPLALAVLLTAGGCQRKSAVADDPDLLVVAISTFSEATFLPWNGSTGRKIYFDTIYDYLFYIDPQSGDLLPGLARDWELSEDGTTYTITLQQGVQFQQGWGEFTAEDVEYTLNSMLDPKSIAGPSSTLRALVDSVAASGRYQVTITLKQPDIEFLRAYLSNGLVVPMISKRYVQTVGDQQANDQPIGTGAYELQSFRKDVAIELAVRQDRENLWRVQPEFTRIRYLSVPEEFTRVAMLKTGEADLAPVNFDSIRALQESGQKVLYVDKNWAPVIRLGGLSEIFPADNVPWQDLRVRQAMNLAIDKQTIVDSIFYGQAAILGTDFPARNFTDIAPYPYDPDRARDLLRQAGFADGFDITLRTFTTNPGAELPIIAQVVALYWNAVGIRTTIVPTNWTSLRSAWSTGNAREIGWTHRGLTFPSTLAGQQSSLMAASVFSTFTDAVTEDYLNRITGSLDPARRSALEIELARYLRDQAAAVFIAHANEPYGASSKVGHWPALSEQSTNIDLITHAEQVSQ